jgi:hypothetical protein
MSSSSWIVPVAVMVITPLIMKAIGRKNAIEPVSVDGLVELRLPKFFGILGWVSVALAAGMAYGSVSILINGELGVGVFVGLIAGMFGWMAFILVRDGRNHRLVYSDTHFSVTDGSRITRSCEWTDVVAGKVHPISKMIQLSTRDGRVLKINAYLIGSDTFFAELARRTNLPVADLVKQARYPG